MNDTLPAGNRETDNPIHWTYGFFCPVLCVDCRHMVGQDGHGMDPCGVRLLDLRDPWPGSQFQHSAPIRVEGDPSHNRYDFAVREGRVYFGTTPTVIAEHADPTAPAEIVLRDGQVVEVAGKRFAIEAPASRYGEARALPQEA